MKQKLMNLLCALALIVVPVLMQPVAAYAGCATGNTSRDQVLQGVGQTGSPDDCGASGVNNIVSAAVTILSYIAGVAAIIMVIIAGFKYTTSGGDSGKVASAKSSLIYALVGLAVAALAQFLVHFALSEAHTAQSPCASNSSISSDSKDCK